MLNRATRAEGLLGHIDAARWQVPVSTAKLRRARCFEVTRAQAAASG